MTPLEFIQSFICPYCKTKVNQSEEIEADYECKCGDSSYTCYNVDEYSFYFNLPGKYQIQIHINSILLSLFSFVRYPKKVEDVFDPYTAFHLELDYIPDNLNWEDPFILTEQLEILTTFK